MLGTCVRLEKLVMCVNLLSGALFAVCTLYMVMESIFLGHGVIIHWCVYIVLFHDFTSNPYKMKM